MLRFTIPKKIRILMESCKAEDSCPKNVEGWLWFSFLSFRRKYANHRSLDLPSEVNRARTAMFQSTVVLIRLTPTVLACPFKHLLLITKDKQIQGYRSTPSFHSHGEREKKSTKSCPILVLVPFFKNQLNDGLGMPLRAALFFGCKFPILITQCSINIQVSTFIPAPPFCSVVWLRQKGTAVLGFTAMKFLFEERKLLRNTSEQQ